MRKWTTFGIEPRKCTRTRLPWLTKVQIGRRRPFKIYKNVPKLESIEFFEILVLKFSKLSFIAYERSTHRHHHFMDRGNQRQVSSLQIDSQNQVYHQKIPRVVTFPNFDGRVEIFQNIFEKQRSVQKKRELSLIRFLNELLREITFSISKTTLSSLGSLHWLIQSFM